MDTRVVLSTILYTLIAAVCVCIVLARRSHKNIGLSVAWLDASLIPPMIGNLIIIGTHTREVAAVGYYIYFIGMNVVMLALMNFASEYCRIEGKPRKHKTPILNYILLGGDTVQLVLNTVFGHAFGLEAVEVENMTYYKLIPDAGQIIPRVMDYSIFGAILLIFFIVTLRTPKIYREKYSIILIAMIAGGLWQTFYIFSGTPIDQSMIGFGIFGLLVYFFAVVYRPLRLLDRMLSNIASEMPEAMFLYDPAGKCVWINRQSCELTGLNENDVESVNPTLTEMFGVLEYNNEELAFCKELCVNEERRYYTISKRVLYDDKSRISGTVIRIRDDTEEQLRIKRELYNATHDKLTGLYTREYLYECIRRKLDSDPDNELGRAAERMMRNMPGIWPSWLIF